MSFDNQIAQPIQDFIARLQQAGYKASYIVGGAVRDYLLGRKPKDYDISTSATPEQVRRVFRDRHCIIIGRRFKLVHLFINHDDIVEISTFRRRPSHEDQVARPPKCTNAPENMIFNDNEFGTPEEDALRRDFTVNALFYDTVSDETIDYTGLGLSDIKNKIVRCIGEPKLRFEEDPVRMLRALKLVGQYGFTLEPETERALMECMPMITYASSARMSLEFSKILKNPYGSDIIDTFHKYGFLKYVLPCLEKHYDDEVGKYTMALWRARDLHVRNGVYDASMSIILSILALPLSEKWESGHVGELWTDYEDLLTNLRRHLLEAIHPNTVMHKDSDNAVQVMGLQLPMRQKMDIPLSFHTRCYNNARELAFLQNEIAWHIPDLEDFYPRRSRKFESNTERNSRRRDRRRRKRAGTQGHSVSDMMKSAKDAENTGNQ